MGEYFLKNLNPYNITAQVETVRILDTITSESMEIISEDSSSESRAASVPFERKWIGHEKFFLS